MNKKPWLSALLNFFFMGLGSIYNGKRVGLGIGFTIGAIALTYVELQLQTSNPDLHKIMFGAVFLINICFAIDGYNEAKKTGS
jgi:hypothetical protein